MRAGSVVVVGVGAVNLKPFVAVAAFNKACIFRDLQPDAGVAEGTCPAVTGDFPMRDGLGLGGMQRHWAGSLIGFGCGHSSDAWGGASFDGPGGVKR